jgi:hypothetical protein
MDLTSQNALLALHEAGHAIVSWHCTLVKNVSIDLGSPASPAAVTRTGMAIPDSRHAAVAWCMNVMKLGGIAAEMLGVRKIHAGLARNDLEAALVATNRIVSSHGLQGCPWEIPTVRSGFDLRRVYRNPLSELHGMVLNACYDHARSILQKRWDAVPRLVSHAQRRVIVSPREIDSLLGSRILIEMFGNSNGRFIF